MTTWTSKPSGPPTAPERAAAAVSSVSMTASTADVNAGLAQAAAGAATDAASAAQSTANNASDAATLAIAKFNAVPEANIVIANVNPDVELEDFGVELLGVGGGTLTGPGGIFNPSDPSTYATWSQSVPTGAVSITVLVGLVALDDFAITRNVVVVSNNPNVVFSQATFKRSPTYGSRWEVRSFTASLSGVDAGSSLVIKVGVQDTSSASAINVLDACSVVSGGTASGDLDATWINTWSDSGGTISAPADSLVVGYRMVYDGKSSGDYTLTQSSGNTPGVTVARSVANLAYAPNPTITSSLLTTKNIDDAETVTMNTVCASGSTRSMGWLIVLKSIARPQTDTLGSFAELRMDHNSGYTYTMPSSRATLSAFNAAGRYSPDLEVSSATASITVDYIGTYEVDAEMLCGETHDVTLYICVNGDIVKARRCSGCSLNIAGLVYAKQGDVISVQAKNNGSGTFTFDDESCKLSISLVNRSYL